MYERMSSLLERNTTGKYIHDNGEIYRYEGTYNGVPISVRAVGENKHERNIIVKYNGENYVFGSEINARKYLSSIINPKKQKHSTSGPIRGKNDTPATPVAFVNGVKPATEDASDVYRDVLSNIKIEFDDIDDKPKITRSYKVGYNDAMPDEDYLSTLAIGVAAGESSNWHSGCINNALRELGLENRYKLIYILNGYYCYDSSNDEVISLESLYERMPKEILLKYGI